ncbi:MAG: DUF5906 domain-containing protein [Syntrophobacteraceae bacterium]
MADLDNYVPYRDYFLQHVAKASVKGEQLVGLCPFHEDRSESFSVNLKRGQWKCFAGCGEGNVIGFHARKAGMEEKEAYRDLCRIYGVENGNGGGSPRTGCRLAESPAAGGAAPKEKSKAISVDTLDLFNQIPAAVLSYLTDKRGWSREIIEKYRIGYNAKLRFSPGNIGEERLTIPVFNELGELVNIRGYRPGASENKLTSWSVGSKKKGTWQGFGEGRLFPIKVLEEARKAAATLYLVEGEPDCLCGLSRGLYCVTGTFGADNWKDEWNGLFRGLRVRIAYDNDEAGRKGMERVCRHLGAFAESVETVTWPEWFGEKEDLTDWFMKHGKSVEEFEGLCWKRVEGEAARNEVEDVRETIRKKVQELNENHAILRLGGKCFVMNKETDVVFKRPDITFSSPYDFKMFYANQKIWVPGAKGMKAVGIGELWLEHEERLQFDGLVFSPGAEVPGCYNLYHGLAVEPRQGSWQKMQEHIYHVICGRDKTIFEYLLAWMADTVQDPGGELPGVSIVMRGGKGIGKGVFARTFGELFGVQHFVHVEHQSHLVGKFNEHLKNALVVFADECFFAGDKQAESTIKRIVTEPTIKIEPKGKSIFTVKNFMRLIIASNECWVVPAGVGERRFLVLDVVNKFLDGMSKREYFEPLYREINNGGKEAMLYDLLGHKYDKGMLRDAPKTDALLDQIEEGMEPEIRFWFYRLKEGTILRTDDRWHEGFVMSDVFHAQFLEFGKSLGKTYLPSPESFIRKIKKICPCARSKREWIGGMKKARGLKFGPLKECRSEFEKVLGQPVDWEDPE